MTSIPSGKKANTIGELMELRQQAEKDIAAALGDLSRRLPDWLQVSAMELDDPYIPRPIISVQFVTAGAPADSPINLEHIGSIRSIVGEVEHKIGGIVETLASRLPEWVRIGSVETTIESVRVYAAAGKPQVAYLGPRVSIRFTI
jgi:hypothetical protein